MNTERGAVILDIGGDVGALVVTAPAELASAEIEICPLGRRAGVPDEGGTWWDGEWRGNHRHAHTTHLHEPAWPHVAVLARTTPRGVEHAAVFPALHSGSYELWERPAGATAIVAHVLGGQVRTVDWPDWRGGPNPELGSGEYLTGHKV